MVGLKNILGHLFHKFYDHQNWTVGNKLKLETNQAATGDVITLRSRDFFLKNVTPFKNKGYGHQTKIVYFLPLSPQEVPCAHLIDLGRMQG